MTVGKRLDYDDIHWAETRDSLSDKNEPNRNSQEGPKRQSEETVDGPLGLERLAELTRRIVQVPKSEAKKNEEDPD